MKSKRVTNRVLRRLQLRYWRKNADPGTGHIGYSKNISPTGLFVVTNAPYNPGTELTIEITSGEERALVVGTVVHAARVAPLLQKMRSSGMGIHLANATDEYLRLAGIQKQAEEVIEPSEPGAYVRVFADTADVRRVLAEEIQFGELSVPTSRPPTEGAPINVEVRFPNSQVPLRCTGHVVSVSLGDDGRSWLRVALSDTALTVRRFKTSLAG